MDPVRHPATWLVTAWAWPLWRVVRATAAGPCTRRDGFATTLTARTVGRDCRVDQQVTVGHTGLGQPVIGDRVSIGADAAVAR